MPTKRTRKARYRRPTDLQSMPTWHSRDGFCWGFHLPHPWSGWAEAMAVYLSVRDELLASRDAEAGRARWGREPFIERAYQRWGDQGPPAGWACPMEARGWPGDEWNETWTSDQVREMDREHNRAILAVLVEV